MADIDNYLSSKRIKSILNVVFPGSKFISVKLAEGSFSNHTHVIEACRLDNETFKIVIRRYAIFGNYDRGEKARREFMTLKFAYENGIPVPKPIYLDEKGELLGFPGIVTDYVEGKLDMTPQNPGNWAKTMAKTLVKIHSLPLNIADGSFILDANAEATWFLRNDKPPDFMMAYPQGKDVWNAAHDLFPRIHNVNPTLVHIDYWPGNILWKNEGISAVVDWEEAAYGDPAIDVAYSRMEMFIMGLSTAADIFLNKYEICTGGKLANLLFWELGAAARPMFSPETWDISRAPRRERFNDFINYALKKFSDFKKCEKK